MQMVIKTRPSRLWPVPFYIGTPLAITALMYATSSHDLSAWQILGAFLLSWFPWASYQQWRSGDRQEIPFFALIASMYWLAYAMPLFWLTHDIALIRGPHHLSEESLTRSVYLAVIGVLALWTGMTVIRRWRWAPSIDLDVRHNPSGWQYLRVALVVGALLSIFVPITAWGAGGRQVIANVEIMVPAVTFVILLRYYLRGRAPTIDRALIFAYFWIALIMGVSSGWLGSFIGLGIMCVAAYIYEKHRLPVTALLVVLPVILFLQPGKEAFRQRYWRAGASENYVERIGFWVDASSRTWTNALSEPAGERIRMLGASTLMRFSLLQQTANVLERTPVEVPYQHDRLYSYMLVTLVPRFIWPNKPSVNDANRWYQASYELTQSRNLGGVSIAVGFLAESYISYGWFGPVLVVFFVGMCLGLLEKTFLRKESGLVLNAIGIALLPRLLGVESQMAEYLAGVAQQIFVAVVVLVPMLQFRSKKAWQRPQAILPGYADQSSRLKSK